MVDESLPITFEEEKIVALHYFLTWFLYRNLQTCFTFDAYCIEICYAFHYKCLDAFNCCSNEIEIATLFPHYIY